MRKKLLASLLLLVICTVGCSNKSSGVLELKGNVICNNGVITDVEEHTGDTAVVKYIGDSNLTIKFSMHKNFLECGNNQAEVAEVNVTKVKGEKGMSYFSAFLGSQYTIHKKMKDSMLCGHLYAPESLDVDMAIHQLTSVAKTVELSNSYKKAIMDEAVEVYNFPEIKVTKNGMTIPGELSVLKGTVNTNEVRTVGDKSVGFLADGAYDYYVNGGYTVKCLKGYDVSQCVNFLN